MTSADIEAIIMESVNERTKEFILRVIGRNAHTNDGQRGSVFDTYDAACPPNSVQVGFEGSPRSRMALQAYRSVAVSGQARG